MYENDVNVNSTAGTKLNIFKKLKNQIEAKNKKGSK